MTLFHSEALFLLLSNFTGLKLHFLAPSEEEEMEGTEEGEAASAPESTEEGTSDSSSEPENNLAAASNSSQQSNEQADPEPEENEAKEGKLHDLSWFPIQHSPFSHSFNKHFLSIYCLLGPVLGVGGKKNTDKVLAVLELTF